MQIVQIVCSQSALEQAHQAYESYEYAVAINFYKSAFSTLSKDTETQALIAFRIGYCYRRISEPLHAQLWLEKAIELRIQEPIVFLYLAEMQRMNENFEDAIQNYERYKTLVPNDVRADKGIESAKVARTWMKDPTEYVVTNLAFVNSKFMDYCPTILKKGNSYSLMFATTRPEVLGDGIHGGSGESFADIFISHEDAKGAWSYPEPLKAINTVHEEGCASVTQDQTRLFYTSCKYDKKDASFCKIYESKRVDGVWKEGVPLKFSDSRKDTADYAHPAVSANGLTLFFASNRSDGYGGVDIWYTTRDNISSEWKRPKNAGSLINTTGDELFPYLRADSTLYFASNGHLGMGGLDIYKVTRDVRGREYILNLLYPINTVYDDYGICFKDSIEEGFLTSNRPGSKGKDDIYHFMLPIRTFALTGSVKNEMTEEPIPYANVRLIGSDGSSLELYADKNGEYAFDLNPQTNYVILAIHDGFLNAKYKISTYGLQKDKDFEISIYMTQIDIPVEIPNIMYDVNRWELRPESIVALEKLLEILRDNPHIIIELSSHTDHRPGRMSNEELSQRRAQSVVNFLIAKGISPNRLYPKGYGAAKPKVIDVRYSELFSFLKLGDVLTPEYIETLEPYQQQIAFQINRRTEFRVIATDFQ